MTDFAREQRILDLAYKLQLGTATDAERHAAADSLSFAAGERLRLEQQVEAYEKALAFLMRVMHLFASIDAISELNWNTIGQDAPLTFYADCSDTFAWGTADSEKITSENIGLLEQSVADVHAARVTRGWWAVTLFCARVRNCRPMPQLPIPAPLEIHFKALGGGSS